jgi:tetraacyldisaccharide 4'-kinase
VRAVAGIGHPEPFFALLEGVGLEIERWPYPDHHAYTQADAARWRGCPVIMTEKDAVKCSALAGEEAWSLPVEAVLDEDFQARLVSKLREFSRG